MSNFNPYKNTGRTRFGQDAKAPTPVDKTNVNPQQEDDDEPGDAEGEGEGETPNPNDSRSGGENGADFDNIESLESTNVGGTGDEGFESSSDTQESVAGNADEDVPSEDDKQYGKLAEDAEADEEADGQHGVAATSKATPGVMAATAVAHETIDTAAANTDVATSEVITAEAHFNSADEPAGVGDTATEVPTETGSGGSLRGGDLLALRSRTTRFTKTMELEIAIIRRDVPMRDIKQETVDEYAELHGAGTVFPRPLVCEEVDSVTGTSIFRLVDGQHRLAAYLALGLTHVEVEVKQGNLREAKLATAASNIYGLPLTNQQKRAVAVLMFEECPTWTSNSIATWTGLSPTFIGNERVRYEAAQGIEPDPDRIRVSTSGKKYKERVRNQPPMVEPAAVPPTALREPPRRIADAGQSVSLPSVPVVPKHDEDCELGSDELEEQAADIKAPVGDVPPTAPTAPTVRTADVGGEQPKVVGAAFASRFTIHYVDLSGAQKKVDYDFDLNEVFLPSDVHPLESVIRNLRTLREKQVPVATLLAICQRAMQD